MGSDREAGGQVPERVERVEIITRRLADCDNPTEVCWTVTESIDGIFSFDAAVTYAHENGQLHPVATIADELYPAAHQGADHGIAGAVLQSGESRITDDLAGEPAPKEHDGFRSALTVPINDERGLQLLSTSPKMFSETDRRYARLICRQAASALNRIAAEHQVQRERDEFTTLFENIADPILRYKIQNDMPVVDEVNSALIQQFMITADAVTETPLNNLPGQLEQTPPEWTAARQGEQVEQRLERQTVDGVRQFLMRTVPGTPDNPLQAGTGYVIYTDVEESRRREQMEVLNRFLRHNVRNDVSVMHGHLDRVIETVDDPAIIDHVTATLRASNRIERRGQKARKAQQLIGKTVDQNPTRFNLVDIVTERADVIRQSFPEVTIDIHCRNRTVEVKTDSSLPLAIDELFENGAAHGGPDPSIEATITATGSTAELAIADDGPGIPDRETRVIERGEETQLNHGRGIGLWLVAWIVDASNGDLSFSTPDDGGSVVSLSLPRPPDPSLEE
ncbi:MAG: histidine kinase-, DNA gyrase B-, and HSP90-like ATPase [halophilic archaeon J07HX5]|jgi:Histidine kinase-, DNA gyrase B-, and HSP90-like ATPase.|nr:MAG: histidine kinase-, DNA gyrase B-, and HSP90-like ATPase [halophilic archaeon J07HX5]